MGGAVESVGSEFALVMGGVVKLDSGRPNVPEGALATEAGSMADVVVAGFRGCTSW